MYIVCTTQTYIHIFHLFVKRHSLYIIDGQCNWKNIQSTIFAIFLVVNRPIQKNLSHFLLMCLSLRPTLCLSLLHIYKRFSPFLNWNSSCAAILSLFKLKFFVCFAPQSTMVVLVQLIVDSLHAYVCLFN